MNITDLKGEELKLALSTISNVNTLTIGYFEIHLIHGWNNVHGSYILIQLQEYKYIFDGKQKINKILHPDTDNRFKKLSWSKYFDSTKNVNAANADIGIKSINDLPNNQIFLNIIRCLQTYTKLNYLS